MIFFRLIIITFLFSLSFRQNNTFAEISENDLSKLELTSQHFKNIPDNNYILGPGDVLSISISKDIPSLDTEMIIDADGTIYLPRIKRIYVSELTINELNKLLNNLFSQYVFRPEAEVRIKGYRPVRVYVKGEVENPGLYTLPGSFLIENNFNQINESSLPKSQLDIYNESKSLRGLSYFPTIFDALKESGGITKYSNLFKIRVIRKESKTLGGGKKSAFINFFEVLEKGNMNNNIRIYDSDIIEVSRMNTYSKDQLGKAISTNLNNKYINVYVLGRVERPGFIKVTKNSTALEAVKLAGGLKAVRGKIELLRYLDNGELDKRRIRLSASAKKGSTKNPFLENGDIVIINSGAFKTSAEAIGDVTKPFVDVYSTLRLFDLIN